MGVRIAADDFGSGYSNLAYLRRLPVDALKLSASFIQEMWRDRQADEPIISALAGLAHTLGLNLTVEGVETSEQASRLAALGCDTAQGWYFARPSLVISSRPCSGTTSPPDSHREDVQGAEAVTDAVADRGQRDRPDGPARCERDRRRIHAQLPSELNAHGLFVADSSAGSTWNLENLSGADGSRGGKPPRPNDPALCTDARALGQRARSPGACSAQRPRRQRGLRLSRKASMPSRASVLAGRGHDLDGVGVGLRLDPSRSGCGTAGLPRALDPADPRVARASSSWTAASSSRVGHAAVDQAPVGGGGRVDGVTGQGHLHRPLGPHRPPDGHHGGGAEPAGLAARGAAKPADSAATARSHEATSWHPAAVARACTRATTTWGSAWTASASAGCRPAAGRGPRPGRRRPGREVVPGGEHRAVSGQDRPRGRRTVADVVGRRPDSSARCARDRALRRSGRFMVTVAKSPERSTRMCSNSMAASARSLRLARGTAQARGDFGVARAGGVRRVLRVPGVVGRLRQVDVGDVAVGPVDELLMTVTLRGLERDGLVSRTIHPVIPPRVDYELTPMGRTLLQTVESWTGSVISGPSS